MITTVATKQNTKACIAPSGPNWPPVIISGPVISVVNRLFVFSLPDVIAPKMPFCVKFHAKCMAIGNHRLL